MCFQPYGMVLYDDGANDPNDGQSHMSQGIANGLASQFNTEERWCVFPRCFEMHDMQIDNSARRLPPLTTLALDDQRPPKLLCAIDSSPWSSCGYGATRPTDDPLCLSALEVSDLTTQSRLCADQITRVVITMSISGDVLCVLTLDLQSEPPRSIFDPMPTNIKTGDPHERR